MSTTEMAHWEAFEAEYGLPDAFHVTAILGTLIASALGDKHAKAEDYSPYYRSGRRGEQTTQQTRAIFDSLLAGVESRKQQRGH